MVKGPLLKLTLGHVAPLGALRYEIVIDDGVNNVCCICPDQVSLCSGACIFYLHCQHGLQYQLESFQKVLLPSRPYTKLPSSEHDILSGLRGLCKKQYCLRAEAPDLLVALHLENAPALRPSRNIQQPETWRTARGLSSLSCRQVCRRASCCCASPKTSFPGEAQVS